MLSHNEVSLDPVDHPAYTVYKNRGAREASFDKQQSQPASLIGRRSGYPNKDLWEKDLTVYWIAASGIPQGTAKNRTLRCGSAARARESKSCVMHSRDLKQVLFLLCVGSM